MCCVFCVCVCLCVFVVQNFLGFLKCVGEFLGNLGEIFW